MNARSRQPLTGAVPAIMDLAPPAEDFVFPSDNALEIPTLRLDRMATAVIAPVQCWGSVRRRDQTNVRTWHFYTDDYRFERLWKSPGDVVATGARICVEPNFSQLDAMPWPVGWYNLYRKRWIARWWQDQGIDIIADLYVGEKYQKWNFLGLPKGWKSFAVRGSGETPQAAVALHADAQQFAETPDIFFYVYGGGIRQAAALRSAGIPCVVSDYYRDADVSTWLENNTAPNIATLASTPRLTTQDTRHGQK